MLLLCGGSVACQSPDRADLTRHLLVYPGRSIVPLPGKAAGLPVVVRNVSAGKLTDLTLEVKAACCPAEVAPTVMPSLAPGDRVAFAVTLRRGSAAGENREPLLLTVRARELPAPAGIDLMVDLSRTPDGQWMDVGQIKIIPRDDARAVYYLLAGTPLLLVMVWMLWRWSQRSRRSTGGG